MLTRCLGLCGVLWWVLGLTGSAGATVIYSYETNAASYSGNAGSTARVIILLHEALNGATTSPIAANAGLIGAGAAVDVTGTTHGSAAQIVTGSFVPNAAFGNPPTTFYNYGTGYNGNNLEFSNSITSIQAHVLPTNGDIVLGTLNVVIGSGSTTYKLTSLGTDTIPNPVGLGGANSNTIAQNGTDFDVSNASYTGAGSPPVYTFTVVGVPEPAAFGLVGVGAAFGLGRRRKANT